MVVKINSCCNQGLNCERIEVESDIAPTQQTAFIIVGLPDAAIQEAKERVRLAIENSGLEFPRHKVIVNLAPADIKKEGPGYDLPMAISILKVTHQITRDLEDSLFVGELALNGELRHTNGILPIVEFAASHGYKKIYLPKINSNEATLIKNIEIYPVEHLRELVHHLQDGGGIDPISETNTDINFEQQITDADMAHIEGQEHAKRALEIAAAGSHNILLSGPPGSGKTLLARTLPTILPSMSREEILEVTKIYSIAGLLPTEKPAVTIRPFRAPHHTSSGIALVGGGKIPRPGEISLAHCGILFLDEFPEFPRIVLDNLRQPLEDGVVSISRAQGTLNFPARFTLVASQNPCPCGYYGDKEKNCTCAPGQIIKYQKKVSGPMLDRIDLHVEVPRISFEKMNSGSVNESSSDIKARVDKAREKQRARFAGTATTCNSAMRPNEIKIFCPLDNQALSLLKNAVNQFHLSGRAFHRILKVGRTIADLAESPDIRLEHIAEALQYRIKN